MVLEVTSLFFIGACLGSFLNVVILRSITDDVVSLSWQAWRGRSHCPQCGHQLRWWELLPVLSYTFLQGSCYHCHQPIAVQYPVVELVMGLLAVIFFIPFPLTTFDTLLAILLLACSAILIALFVIDLYTMLLPDPLIILLTFLAVGLVILKIGLSRETLYTMLSGMTIGVGFLGALWLVTRGKGLGLGDVKLMIPLGIAMGPVGIAALLFISFMVGGVVSIGLLLRGRAQLKTPIPFGPFLCGTAIVLLMWPSIITTLRNFVFVGGW